MILNFSVACSHPQRDSLLFFNFWCSEKSRIKLGVNFRLRDFKNEKHVFNDLDQSVRSPMLGPLTIRKYQ